MRFFVATIFFLFFRQLEKAHWNENKKSKFDCTKVWEWKRHAYVGAKTIFFVYFGYKLCCCCWSNSFSTNVNQGWKSRWKIKNLARLMSKTFLFDISHDDKIRQKKSPDFIRRFSPAVEKLEKHKTADVNLVYLLAFFENLWKYLRWNGRQKLEQIVRNFYLERNWCLHQLFHLVLSCLCCTRQWFNKFKKIYNESFEGILDCEI